MFQLWREGGFRKGSLGGCDSKNGEAVTSSPGLAQQCFFESVVAVIYINSIVESPVMLNWRDCCKAQGKWGIVEDIQICSNNKLTHFVRNELKKLNHSDSCWILQESFYCHLVVRIGSLLYYNILSKNRLENVCLLRKYFEEIVSEYSLGKLIFGMISDKSVCS